MKRLLHYFTPSPLWRAFLFGWFGGLLMGGFGFTLMNRFWP